MSHGLIAIDLTRHRVQVTKAVFELSYDLKLTSELIVNLCGPTNAKLPQKHDMNILDWLEIN